MGSAAQSQRNDMARASRCTQEFDCRCRQRGGADAGIPFDQQAPCAAARVGRARPNFRRTLSTLIQELIYEQNARTDRRSDFAAIGIAACPGLPAITDSSAVAARLRL